jgi:Autophagy protein 16 (ATG16)/WD domain, G-beta repeat
MTEPNDTVDALSREFTSPVSDSEQIEAEIADLPSSALDTANISVANNAELADEALNESTLPAAVDEQSSVNSANPTCADDATLLETLLTALKQRNAVETVPFVGVFSGHQALRRANVKLRRQNIAADKELIILRHKLSEGLTLGESNDAVSRHLGELSRLQVQVTDKYRGQAEFASEQLRLMKRVQDLEEALRHSSSSLERLQLEHGESMARGSELEAQLAELRADSEHLQAELDSVRALLAAAEKSAETAVAENQALVQRTMTDRLHMLDEMNRMTDEVQMYKAAVAAGAATTTAVPASRHRRQSDSDIGRAAALGLPPPGSSDATAAAAAAAQGGSGSASSSRRTSASSSGGTAVPSRCRHKLPAHSAGINDVVYSDSGALLATASDDGSVKLFDSSSGQQRSKLAAGGGAGISMLSAALRGDLVAAGCSDACARVWNYSSGRAIAHLTGHQQRVCCVAFWGGAAGGTGARHLLTGSHDCSLKLWDLEKQWNTSPQLMRAQSKVNAMDVSGGAVLVSGHFDGGA